MRKSATCSVCLYDTGQVTTYRPTSVAKAVVVKEKTEKIDKQKLKLNVKQDERNKYYNY